MKSSIDRDIVAGIALIVFALLGFLAASQIENMVVTQMSGSFFPKVLFTILLLCGVTLIVQGKRRQEKIAVPAFVFSRLFKMTFLLAVYVFIMDYVGFIISTFLFMLSSMYLFGIRKIIVLLGVSVCTAIVIYFLFTEGFKIVLPGIPGIDM